MMLRHSCQLVVAYSVSMANGQFNWHVLRCQHWHHYLAGCVGRTMAEAEYDDAMELDLGDIVADEVAAAEIKESEEAVDEGKAHTQCSLCGAKDGCLDPTGIEAEVAASGHPWPFLQFRIVNQVFLDFLCFIVKTTLFPFMTTKDAAAQCRIIRARTLCVMLRRSGPARARVCLCVCACEAPTPSAGGELGRGGSDRGGALHVLIMV